MSRYNREGNRTNPGDELASGGRSAVFTGPHVKFDEGKMRDDLKKLPAEDFIMKYLITQREYDLLASTKDDEKISIFAKDMAEKAEFYGRGIALDEQQAASLKRDCFITPYVPIMEQGKVIVDRDEPMQINQVYKHIIAPPNSLRKERTLLPTTGHIIKAVVYRQQLDGSAADVSQEFVGKRILFGQMSGTAICFKGYPTWTQLDLAEIMAWVGKEDAETESVPLEPLV